MNLETDDKDYLALAFFIGASTVTGRPPPKEEAIDLCSRKVRGG